MKNLLSKFGALVRGTQGVSAAPFVAVITSVLVIVIGLNLGSVVVENTDTLMTNATGAYALVGTIGEFLPVVFLAGLMGIASVVGMAGVGASGDRFTSMILTVLIAVIGIVLASSVITASQSIDTAVATAQVTNPGRFSLVATLTPFIPVVYTAAVLSLASLAGLRAYRQDD